MIAQQEQTQFMEEANRDSSPLGQFRLGQWAWLPPPLLILAILGVSIMDTGSLERAPYVLLVLNFFFSVPIAIMVAYLFGRSFIVHGTPGLLFLGGGTLMWGASGCTGIMTSLVAKAGFDPNISVTIHNICLWEASLCYLAGTVSLLRWGGVLQKRRLWLAGAYLIPLGAITYLIFSTNIGWIPVFFVQGEGGTLVRSLTLGCTIAVLLLTIALLRVAPFPLRLPFVRWFNVFLILQALGYLILLFAKVFGGKIGLFGQATQYLGSVYLFLAALLIYRKEEGQLENMAAVHYNVRHPYWVAFIGVLIAAVLRLVFLQALGTQTVYITFFPVVMLVSLYGGFFPGIAATLFSLIVVDYLWLVPANSLFVVNPADRLAMMLFLVSGAMICWVADKLEKSNEKLRLVDAARREDLERLVAERTENLTAEMAIRKKAEQAMLSALSETEAHKIEAERANLSKSKFLAAASHDLRQPVQSLALLLPAMESYLADQAKAARVLTMMKTAVDGLGSLLTCILDLCRLDAAQIVPVMKSVECRQLLQRLACEYTSAAANKGLELRLVAQDLRVWTDPELLERALRNLIENAIRYTSQGGLIVGMRRRGERIRIDIIDTGIGIAADRHKEIFEEFYQINNPGRDPGKGMGLGLAIVSRLSALLHAEIQVTSRVGRGSRFSLWIPLDDSASQSAAEPVSETPDPGGRILIIEDNMTLRQGFAIALEAWGYDVLSAASGEEAIDLALRENGRFDAIITDQRLGAGCRGTFAAQEIAHQAGRTIPTIVVTGDMAVEPDKEISHSGFVILHKPVRANDLRSSLVKLLQDRALPARLSNAG